MQTCDVVVVGLGAMGSAAAWHLARRGRRVVALEQFAQGHDRGSSHGSSRIFRLAYEQDDYVALAQEALTGWRDLETEAGVELLTTTGAIDTGDAQALDRIGAAMARNGIVARLLDAADAARRWAGIRFDGPVLFSPDGGRVDADATRLALQTRAAQLGADLRFSTAVRRVEDGADGVTVVTDTGEITAPVVVVTVNAWASTLLGPAIGVPPLRVTQEQPAFFRRRDAAAVWPSFVHYAPDAVAGGMATYGLDSPHEGGVKVGEHGTGVPVDPDGHRPPVDPERLERLAAYVAQHLPGLEPEPFDTVRCLYATTPSEDFVLDRVGRVVVGVGFSGHGFKFVPAIGRVLADLADGTQRPAARFLLARS